MATRNRLIRRIDYVDPRGYEYYDVDIDVLVPDPENPRIPPQELSTLETMLALFRLNASSLFRLAEDLAKVGTNPAELLNVTRLGPKLFLVKEGNRRLTARKLLRNPEQLRGHVTPTELRRWQKLASRVTTQLSTRQLVVVGENHDTWVFRRHQGNQDGVGVSNWGPEAKSRHLQQKLGRRNRAMALRDALMANYPERFPELPGRSFSVFERLMDSGDTRAHLGIDVNEDGHPKLTRGERSLRMLEELVNDLRRPRGDRERLTTRTINTVEGAHEYLQKLDNRIDQESPPENEITLVAPMPSGMSAGAQVSAAPVSGLRSGHAPTDVLKSFNEPAAARLRKIFDELVKVKKSKAPNAAMVLTRVLLELSVDEYSQRTGVDFEAPDAELKQQIQELRTFLSLNGYKIPKKLNNAIGRAGVFAPSIGQKLDAVLVQLQGNGSMSGREAAAKSRELRDKEVVNVLNDAVHRLENFPSIERVNYVLEIIRPIFNGIHQ